MSNYDRDVRDILDIVAAIENKEEVDFADLREKLKTLGREADSEISSLDDEKTTAENKVEFLEEKLAAFERKFEAAVEILRANGLDVSEGDVDLAASHARPAEFLRKLGVIRTVREAAQTGMLRDHVSCSPGFCHDWYAGLTPTPCAVSGLKGRYLP